MKKRKSLMRNRFGVAGLGIVAILLLNSPDHSIRLSASELDPRYPEAGKVWEMPRAFSAQDILGRRWDTERLKGNVVLLHFWATWCSACVSEIEELRGLEERFADKGLVILGISLDSANRHSIVTFLNKHRVSWPQIHDSRGFSGDLARTFAVRYLPATVLLSREGRLISEFRGCAELGEAVEKEMQR